MVPKSSGQGEKYKMKLKKWAGPVNGPINRASDSQGRRRCFFKFYGKHSAICRTQGELLNHSVLRFNLQMPLQFHPRDSPPLV